LCREPSELGLTGFALEESFSKGPRKWRPRPKKSTGFSSALAKFEGRRKQRIEAAEGAVNRSEAEYELSRLQIIQRVKLAYWAARGAQETRDLLKASVKTFQEIADYHSARLSVGAISEQDFLRVRLEAEWLQIAANLAAIEATRARVQLLREMGRRTFPK
jgi:outer membrane protein TolC